MKKNRNALLTFQTVKSEYQQQITHLNHTKSHVQASTIIENKSKLCTQIDNHLTEINEEMFALSDELARAFITSYNSAISEQEQEALLNSKAKEFEQRKIVLIKKINQTLSQEQVAKLLRRVQTTSRSRSVSPADRSRSSSSIRQQKKLRLNPKTVQVLKDVLSPLNSRAVEDTKKAVQVEQLPQSGRYHNSSSIETSKDLIKDYLTSYVETDGPTTVIQQSINETNSTPNAIILKQNKESPHREISTFCPKKYKELLKAESQPTNMAHRSSLQQDSIDQTLVNDLQLTSAFINDFNRLKQQVVNLTVLVENQANMYQKMQTFLESKLESLNSENQMIKSELIQVRVAQQQGISELRLENQNLADEVQRLRIRNENMDYINQREQHFSTKNQFFSTRATPQIPSYGLQTSIMQTRSLSPSLTSTLSNHKTATQSSIHQAYYDIGANKTMRLPHQINNNFSTNFREKPRHKLTATVQSLSKSLGKENLSQDRAVPTQLNRQVEQDQPKITRVSLKSEEKSELTNEQSKRIRLEVIQNNKTALVETSTQDDSNLQPLSDWVLKRMAKIKKK